MNLYNQLDQKLKNYLRRRGITTPLGFKEEILVGVYASPYASQLVRATYRIASELGGVEWIALFVETEKSKDFTEEEKKWLERALDLARRLGGRVERIKGKDVAQEIINYAKREGITKIVLGKPRREGALTGSIYKKLILETEGIDIYLISSKVKIELPKTTEKKCFSKYLNILRSYFKRFG